MFTPRTGHDPLTRTYQPQLDHIGFDWINDENYFAQKLALVEGEILKRVGFTRNDGCVCIVSAEGMNFITAQTTLMNDIAGTLAWAAAVKMDGDFKAANKVIATLKAVAENPGMREVATANIKRGSRCSRIRGRSVLLVRKKTTEQTRDAAEHAGD